MDLTRRLRVVNCMQVGWSGLNNHKTINADENAGYFSGSALKLAA